MYRTTQYILIFVSIGIFISTARGDAFDQTVAQIKTLETELKQNRETALKEIKQRVATEREANPLSAPKDQFESDEDYRNRLGKFESVLSGVHTQIWDNYLKENLSLISQITSLYNRVFQTNDLTVTLGTYDGNRGYFPVTLRLPLNGESQRLESWLYIGKNDARDLFNNWDQVIKTGYISIDPGHRRGLVKVKLENPISSQEFVLDLNLIYDLSRDNRRVNRNDTAVAFDPNGKYLAVGWDTRGEPMNIYEISGGKKFWSKDPGAGYSFPSVPGVAFSPNGEYVTALTDPPRGIIHFTTRTGRELWKRTFKGPNAEPHSIDFSPNGQYIAVGTSGGNIFLRNMDGRGLTVSTKSNEGSLRIYKVSFSPNGAYLAAGGSDGTVWISEVGSWWSGSNIIGHELKTGGDVYAVAFSPNGRYIAVDGVVGSDNFLTIWEVNSRDQVLAVKVDFEIRALAFSPDGQYLAVGTESPNLISFYRIKTGGINLTAEIIKGKTIQAVGAVRNLAWSPSGNLISDGKKVYRVLLHPEVHKLDE